MSETKSPKQDQRQSSDKPDKLEDAESIVNNPGGDLDKPDKLRRNNASENIEDEGELFDLDDLEEDDEDDTLVR